MGFQRCNKFDFSHILEITCGVSLGQICYESTSFLLNHVLISHLQSKFNIPVALMALPTYVNCKLWQQLWFLLVMSGHIIILHHENKEMEGFYADPNFFTMV